MLLFGRPQMGDGLNFGISEWAKIIARHGNDDDAILVGRGNPQKKTSTVSVCVVYQDSGSQGKHLLRT